MNRKMLLATAMVAPLIVTGCAESEPPVPDYEIRLEVTSWGYGPDGAVSNTESFAFDVYPGGSFSIPGFVEDELKFTITDIRDGEVRFSTSTDLAPAVSPSGHDQNNLKNEWTVALGGSTQFATASQDAGETYEVFLIEDHG